MNAVERLFKEKMAIGVAKQVAKGIKKEDFMAQLKTTWKDIIDYNKSTDEIVDSCIGRIKAMKFIDVFKVVGVTRKDLYDMIEELKNDSSEYINTP